MAPTIPVFTLGLPELLQQVAMQELAAGALARFRADVARTRSDDPDDTDARSTTIVIGPGDSLTEAFAPTVRGTMWTRYLDRRLNGPRMGGTQFIPASANTFNVQNAWPGNQAPWTYSAAPAGDVLHGPDLHAVIMVSGSTATINWFGEVISVLYTRTTTGPAAAAVTLDGVAQTAIAANGTELPGQQATFVADGYGYHTLVITSTSGQLNLEGATVSDNEIFGFGVPCRNVRTLAFGHAGFQSSDYLTRPNWSTSLVNLSGNSALGSYPSLYIIGLGSNDQVQGTTADQFEENIISIVRTIDLSLDAAGISTDPGFLFMAWPGMQDAYVQAMWNARQRYDPLRCGVLDLRHYMPRQGVDLDIFNSGGHPNDAGQRWVADVVGDFIDNQSGVHAPRTAPATSRLDVIIEAVTPAAFRQSWAESLGLTGAAGGEVFDTSPADAGVNERRHRVWLERGTYQARLRYGELTTTGGTGEVFVGGTSLGTQSTTGTTGNIGEVTLGTSVVIDSPGAYPVRIRCTTANSAALRFIRLYLRKTA